MVVKRACCALMFLFCSCSSYKEPYLNLRVEFDPAMVDVAKEFLLEAAKTRGWFVYENKMIHSNSSGGHGEFSVFMAPHEEAVRQNRWLVYALSAETSLSVQVYDYGDIPLAELDSFARHVEVGLENVTGSKVCRKHTRKSYCDEPTEPLLRYKARVVSSMVAETGNLLWQVQRAWPNLRVHDVTGLMDEVTGRSDAFEVLLFFNPPTNQWDKVLKISNEADPRIVLLELYEVADMPNEEIRRLSNQTREAMEARFGSRFCRVNLLTGLCDAELAGR